MKSWSTPASCRARRFTLFLLSILFVSSAAGLPLSNVDGRDLGGAKRCGDENCSSPSTRTSEVEGSMRNIFEALFSLTSINSIRSEDSGISDGAGAPDASILLHSRLPSITLSRPSHRRADTGADTFQSDSSQHFPGFAKIFIIVGSFAVGLALILGLLWFITFIMRRNSDQTGKRRLKSKVPKELAFEPDMNSYRNIEIRSPATPTYRLPPAHDPFSDHHAVGHLDTTKDVYLHPPRSPRV